MKKRWGLEYTIKLGSKWDKEWCGPLWYIGCPIVFHTRREARAAAKERSGTTSKTRAIRVWIEFKRA